MGLHARRPGTWINLGGLARRDAAAWLEWRLEQRAQRVSEAELGALLAHDGARSPRWLLRASERLRRSARFEELREEIAAVAATEAALLESELEEVEEAAGGGAARAARDARDLVEEGFTFTPTARRRQKLATLRKTPPSSRARPW